MSTLKKLIVILGPTASGKSDLAFKLAKKFNGEVISADSRQIYKGMDIGTAKSKEPQHLIDIIKPDEEFTLAQYKKLAVEKIKEVDVPFLVGGTGLYIQAVVDNLDIPQVEPNPDLRKELEKLTLEELFKKLKELDPEIQIDPNNKRRLIRAIEVCSTTGKPFPKKRNKPLFDVLQIGLKTTDEKINQRVDEMFKKGLEKEVKDLIKEYSPDLPAFSGIGYKEIIENPETAREQIKLHTRQYAKRQMTWFKRDKRIHWIENYQKAEKLVQEFLKK